MQCELCAAAAAAVPKIVRGCPSPRPSATFLFGVPRGERLAAHNERRQSAKPTRSCGYSPRWGEHCSLPGFARSAGFPRSQPRSPLVVGPLRRNSGSFLWFSLLLPKERTSPFNQGTKSSPYKTHRHTRRSTRRCGFRQCGGSPSAGNPPWGRQSASARRR